MMHSDPEVEFRELLRSQAMQEFLAVLDEGPQRCDEYLRQLEEGNRIPSVSMMLVVQKAGNRARDQISLEWAEIAVRAANLWAIEGGSSDPAVALLHAMTLRAWFISRIGSRAGDPILDKEIILGWFTAEQKLSLAEAKERAARWKNTRLPINDRLPLNEVRELRGIKNRLRIIKTLQECGELPQDSYLNEWLEIRRSLP